MFAKPLNDEEVWNALPLSMEQRETIYNDFILAKKYDVKIKEKWISVEEKKWGNMPISENADTEKKN